MSLMKKDKIDTFVSLYQSQLTKFYIIPIICLLLFIYLFKKKTVITYKSPLAETLNKREKKIITVTTNLNLTLSE